MSAYQRDAENEDLPAAFIHDLTFSDPCLTLKFGKDSVHILILASWYPSSEDPVTGIFIQDQAMALKKAGHQIGVIHPFVPGLRNIIRGYQKITAQVISHDRSGIKLYRGFGLPLGAFPRLNLRQKGMLGSMLFKNYVRDNGRPDLIHAHVTLPAGIIATVLKEKYDLPLVITEHHSAFARKLIPPWQKPMIRCLS